MQAVWELVVALTCVRQQHGTRGKRLNRSGMKQELRDVAVDIEKGWMRITG